MTASCRHPRTKQVHDRSPGGHYIDLVCCDCGRHPRWPEALVATRTALRAKLADLEEEMAARGIGS